MTAALRIPSMTQSEFFAWAEARQERYEFDGFEPVAMVGGSIAHSRISGNIYFALRRRLQGGRCEPLGPDAGMATVGDSVRYPDVLVSCAASRDSDRLAAGVVAVFEVISPSTAREDRFIKLREYHRVPGIRHYVIVEQDQVAITVHTRQPAELWATTALLEGDTLSLEAIGVEIPIAEFYENVALADGAGGDTVRAG